MSESRNQQRVFVVDDEQIIASTLALILRQQGFNATSFTDPLKALQASRADTPDLLITDGVMPELSGVELAMQIRAHCPACKVLLISGQAVTIDLLSAAREGGHDFELLLKPVHPAELLAKIDILIQCAPLGPQFANFNLN